MATGWARDGAVQDQIDASVEDAVERARSRLPKGESLTHCEECGVEIPEARREVIEGVRPRSAASKPERHQSPRQQGQPITLDYSCGEFGNVTKTHLHRNHQSRALPD